MKWLLTLFFLPVCLHLRAELFFTQDMITSHLKGYSEADLTLIRKDLDVVRSVCLGDTHNTQTRFYLATAGAPGARKTTILERFIATHPEFANGVYLDPDPRTLRFMAHTYYAQSLNALTISNTKTYDEVIQIAYSKWRGGSNYIALTLLEEAFALGRSVTHGTTSTGSHIPAFFSTLKANDYKIVLLLCSCPDEVRRESVSYRNDVIRFYQSSPEDAVSKGLLFPQRVQAYFAYADQLYFFWSDSLFSPERLAGIWTNEKLVIIDDEAMRYFIDKYESDRCSLQASGITLPRFDTYCQFTSQ